MIYLSDFSKLVIKSKVLPSTLKQHKKNNQFSFKFANYLRSKILNFLQRNHERKHFFHERNPSLSTTQWYIDSILQFSLNFSYNKMEVQSNFSTIRFFMKVLRKKDVYSEKNFFLSIRSQVSKLNAKAVYNATFYFYV